MLMDPKKFIVNACVNVSLTLISTRQYSAADADADLSVAFAAIVDDHGSTLVRVLAIPCLHCRPSCRGRCTFHRCLVYQCHDTR